MEQPLDRYQPNEQLSHIEQVSEKRVVTRQETETFFKQLSFSNFHDDINEMVERSELEDEKEKHILLGLAELYKELENGFDVDNLTGQYDRIVGVPTNEEEKDIQSYFIYSMKKLYENFRRTHHRQ